MGKRPVNPAFAKATAGRPSAGPTRMGAASLRPYQLPTTRYSLRPYSLRTTLSAPAPRPGRRV